jgi:hypothetical protein
MRRQAVPWVEGVLVTPELGSDLVRRAAKPPTRSDAPPARARSVIVPHRDAARGSSEVQTSTEHTRRPAVLAPFQTEPAGLSTADHDSMAGDPQPSNLEASTVPVS